MINYEYYKIFYYVGKYKSITKAAQMLYSSQPAVTRIIQKLENELECKLFVRSQAGMDFTQEGKTLFDYVSIAYNQLERGEDEIRRCAVRGNGHDLYRRVGHESARLFIRRARSVPLPISERAAENSDGLEQRYA